MVWSEPIAKKGMRMTIIHHIKAQVESLNNLRWEKNCRTTYINRATV